MLNLIYNDDLPIYICFKMSSVTRVKLSSEKIIINKNFSYEDFENVKYESAFGGIHFLLNKFVDSK